jgi:hypothetical protein
MQTKMTAAEIADVFKLPGEQRLALFLENAAKNKTAFGISDEEGWALLGDKDDTDILPLFYDADLAESFRKAAGFEGYEVEMLELDELLEWLEDLEEDGMMIAICPNTRFEGAIVEPGQLKADLEKQA